jgi:hypothetical protein
MSEKESKPEDKLKKLLYKFISEPKDNEFEIRFGTKGIKRINKSDFDNVIKYLLSKGFIQTKNNQVLKIRNEYTDTKTGKSKISNLRTEVEGTHFIQKICKNKTNSIIDEDGNIINGIKFVQKTGRKDKDGNIIKPADFDDFNFRATLQEEKNLSKTSGLVRQLLNDWDDKKKLFRLVTRYSYTKTGFENIRVDMSIVKHSKTNVRGNMVPTYNIQESELFNSSETYEIEIEIEQKKQGFLDTTKQNILNNLRTTIKYVLSGLQKTNYPVSYNEMRIIATEYLKIIYKDDIPKRLLNKHFIGPSSISLELKNIQPISEDTQVANIRNPYTVTDKADGDRKLLVINKDGKIYFIDTNMNIQFTGMKTKSKEHFNSILDGEHIIHDRRGNYLNLYAAFDIYFINNEDQRNKKFVNHLTDSDENLSNFRLNQLDTFVNTLNVEHIVNGSNNLVINRKIFEVSPDERSIFNACRKIYERIDSDLYQYETDGLIFTPCDLGVAMTYGDKEPINYKQTWLHSFKWKPPEYNTIDFLVTTVKTESGQDLINNIFEDGKDMVLGNQIKQYKTLILRVGFDEKKHGYINPCEDIIKNKLPKYTDLDNDDGYRPMPFYPTNPYINKAYLCNIMLKDVGMEKHMFTEDGEEGIEDETIVEFKYIKDNELGWNWIPIRVRYDKTTDYRNGIKNYGNAYHVAQSVWTSIHNPITKNMLISGMDIPVVENDDDVYYNTYGKSLTKSLRDFHNLYVKNKLISAASAKGGTLIDLAVGKGGDIPKWISAKLKFVLGIDISKDNIENRLNGACSRYLNYYKKFTKIPRALFVNGNSKLNIRNGEAIFNEKGKEIIQAINGKGPKDKDKLGEGVYLNYGIGKEGFNVVSCQFAIHYFFENPETLHNFLQNVSENCKEGGYFIGTSYDGKHIFNALEDKNMGESIEEFIDDKKIWEIRKGYDQETFDNNSSCLGLAIDVYQETINKVFREYLVNYDYLTMLLQSYGFELISVDEANKLKLPNSTGMFSELYSSMQNDINRQQQLIRRGKTTTELEVGTAVELDNEPKQRKISFMNRYFIYKKVSNVNAEQIKLSMLGKSYVKEKDLEISETKSSVKVAEKSEKIEKSEKLKIKKLKGKTVKLKIKTDTDI